MLFEIPLAVGQILAAFSRVVRGLFFPWLSLFVGWLQFTAYNICGCVHLSRRFVDFALRQKSGSFVIQPERFDANTCFYVGLVLF